MSRIGKQPIEIPDGVQVTVKNGLVKVRGPKGELEQELTREITVEEKDKTLIVSVGRKSKNSPALWGLTRALIQNMIVGVTDGYEKRLEIQGVGYRAELTGKDLLLNLGFSHTITITPPEGITFLVEKNIITITGINKQAVGQISAVIRKKRPPEPYKGKGIRYVGEHVRRKTGKKAAATVG